VPSIEIRAPEENDKRLPSNKSVVLRRYCEKKKKREETACIPCLSTCCASTSLTVVVSRTVAHTHCRGDDEGITGMELSPEHVLNLGEFRMRTQQRELFYA